MRDEIAIPNIGEKYYNRYMPYLLTVFFLIWIGNLFGLIPFFPFAGTVTNNILFTGMLAIFTLILTLFSSNKHYWKHIFAPPGVPTWILPIMIPIEMLSVFTKPFCLDDTFICQYDGRAHHCTELDFTHLHLWNGVYVACVDSFYLVYLYLGAIGSCFCKPMCLHCYQLCL